MKDRTLLYQFIFGVCSALFILTTTYIYYYKGHINFEDIAFNKLGVYGDFIGGTLGTILSIVAVILVYRTYISQKIELELNREILSSQQFENTFFNLLQTHQRIKENISADFSKIEMAVKLGNLDPETVGHRDYYNEKLKGKEFFIGVEKVFRDLWKYEANGRLKVINKIDRIHDERKYKYDSPFVETIDNKTKTSTRKNLIEHKEDIKWKYRLFWEYFDRYLGDYLRNVYHILKFLSKKETEEMLKQKNKIIAKKKFQHYSDIFQSQMSFSELFIIYYNSYEFKNMKSLVSKYNFVENLHCNNLLDIRHSEISGFGKIKCN